MPVGIANKRIAVRRPDNASGRNVIGSERLVRPPDRLAVAEQLDVWRFR